MADCECEKASQSDFPSPGAVHLSEEIVRLVYLPEEIAEDGTLKPTSIEKKELKRLVDGQKCERGFSINRCAFIDDDVLRSKATEHRDKMPDQRLEVWTFKGQVEAIRSLKLDDGSQQLCVVDRAESDDQSHAECWGARAGRGDSLLRKIRTDLASKLTLHLRVL